jgi:hypothetical protein
MAYTEKLLPVEALLGMWQQRRAQETDNSNSMTPIQEAMAKEQLKSMQEKNKMAELTRGLLTPGAKNPVMDSPYTQGFPAYQQEQDRIKNAALATGQSLPNQGFSGGGYGGGGESQPIPAQESGMTYTGPDHSQNSTVDIANALGQLYRPGGEDIPQQPQTMADALADEQQNKAGYESLIKEKYSMPSPETTNNLMANTDPVAAAIAKRDADNRVFSDLYMSGAAPLPKTLKPEDQLNLVNQKKVKEKTEKLPETINNTRSKLKGTVGFDELYPDRQKYLMAEVANIVRQTGGQPDLYAIVSAELEKQTAEAAKKKSTTK